MCAPSNNGNTVFVSRSVYSQTKSIYICLLNCKLQDISFGCDRGGNCALNITAESHKEERLKPPRCSLVKLRAYGSTTTLAIILQMFPLAAAAVKERHSATFPRSVIPAPPARTTRSLHQSGATLPNMIPACCASLRFSSSGLNSSHQLSDVDPYLRFLLTPAPPPRH